MDLIHGESQSQQPDWTEPDQKFQQLDWTRRQQWKTKQTKTTTTELDRKFETGATLHPDWTEPGGNIPGLDSELYKTTRSIDYGKHVGFRSCA